MLEATFSDDRREAWLSPERVQGALGLLNWSRGDLVQRAGVDAEELRLFIDYGVPMGMAADAAIKRVLLAKVCLSIEEGQPGVLLKRETMEALGPGKLVFGGPMTRRPKL